MSSLNCNHSNVVMEGQTAVAVTVHGVCINCNHGFKSDWLIDLSVKN